MSWRAEYLRTKPCVVCAEMITADEKTKAWLCHKHRREYGKAKSRAHVRMDALRKFLVPAKEFQCVDCGNPACTYDHRDYADPSRIVPVCRGCNGRRGPGAWVTESGKKITAAQMGGLAKA